MRLVARKNNIVDDVIAVIFIQLDKLIKLFIIFRVNDKKIYVIVTFVKYFKQYMYDQNTLLKKTNNNKSLIFSFIESIC